MNRTSIHSYSTFILKLQKAQDFQVKERHKIFKMRGTKIEGHIRSLT